MDINNLTTWTGKGLLSFYSAIVPQIAAPPTLSSQDTELLHKTVERAQVSGGRKSELLLQRNAEVCTSSLVRTNVLKYQIFVTQDTPIKQKSFLVSLTKHEVMKELVEEMLAAEPSTYNH